MSLSRDEFFASTERQGLALTFDDVRLATAQSKVSTREVDLTSYFSRNIKLGVPLVSAAMDTVTTADMAIAMAKLGGLGVLHAGLTPEQQAKEARRVKHELNAVIKDPITFSAELTLGDILSECDRRQLKFRTFPITDNDGRFVGLLTQNDFDFSLGNSALAVEAAMTPAHDVVTGTPDTNMHKAFAVMREHGKKTLPLLTEDGKVSALYVLSDVVRSLAGNPERHNLDDSGRLLVAAAVPTDEGALERIEAMGDYLDVIVVDSAQGDSYFAFQALRLIKDTYPDLDVVVGNISSSESAVALADAGADGIKVGQGPGSICTTRIETGIGSPQVSAVYECVQAIKGSGVPICADGGIVNRGDVSLAIAAGASSVMMGGQLAGTKEAPGEVTSHNGAMVKLYRGMGSASAMRDSEASRKRYGVDSSTSTPLPEGVESYVPYKGPVDDVVNQLIMALRKSMSYVGSPDIETHRTETRFLRVTNAGMAESRPHDVTVIQR
ncbi:IMP dehydrogenase [Candidatus Saccharibacteria bacterium]|nr:IMP dehydrogenase [Candidatus Saccharibacteria bacterium]